MSATSTETVTVPREAVEKAILELHALAELEYRRERGCETTLYYRISRMAEDFERAAGLEPAWYSRVEVPQEEYEAWKAPIRARGKEMFDDYIEDLKTIY